MSKQKKIQAERRRSIREEILSAIKSEEGENGEPEGFQEPGLVNYQLSRKKTLRRSSTIRSNEEAKKKIDVDEERAKALY